MTYMPKIVRHEDDGSKTDMTLVTNLYAKTLERLKVALQIRGTDRNYVDWAESLVKVSVCAEEHLSYMGACPDSVDDDSLCSSQDCTYCRLARSVGDV